MTKRCVVCDAEFKGRRGKKVCGDRCLRAIRSLNATGRRHIPPPVADENGCLIWQGRLTPAGYGRSTIVGRMMHAHRAAWIEAHGPVPADIDVDHICRNRACVNLEHLRLASRAENLQNRASKPESTSRYRGVSWSKKEQRWVAMGCLNYRKVRIGSFKDEDEAGAAAAAWRREHMPFSVEAPVG